MEKMIKISFKIPEQIIRGEYPEDSFTLEKAIRCMLADMVIDGLQACGKLDDFVKELQIS